MYQSLSINLSDRQGLSIELYCELLLREQGNAVFTIHLNTKSCLASYTLLTRQSASILNVDIVKLIKEH